MDNDKEREDRRKQILASIQKMKKKQRKWPLQSFSTIAPKEQRNSICEKDAALFRLLSKIPDTI